MGGWMDWENGARKGGRRGDGQRSSSLIPCGFHNITDIVSSDLEYAKRWRCIRLLLARPCQGQTQPQLLSLSPCLSTSTCSPWERGSEEEEDSQKKDREDTSDKIVERYKWIGKSGSANTYLRPPLFTLLSSDLERLERNINTTHA